MNNDLDKTSKFMKLKTALLHQSKMNLIKLIETLKSIYMIPKKIKSIIKKLDQKDETTVLTLTVIKETLCH